MPIGIGQIGFSDIGFCSFFPNAEDEEISQLPIGHQPANDDFGVTLILQSPQVWGQELIQMIPVCAQYLEINSAIAWTITAE